MSRITICLLLAGAAVSVFAAGVLAAPTPQVREIQMRPIQHVDLSLLNATRLSQEFEAALAGQNVAQDRRRQILEQYRQLPEDLQLSLLSAFDRNYAEASLRPDLYIARIDPELLGRVLVRLFRITSFWPSQGAPGAWSYAFGNGFNADCKVYFDGSQVESHYLDIDVEFFPRSMAFKVPTGATRDQDHQVLVRNMTSTTDTAAVAYEIVAPRGYRGYHGWKFSNFSRPSIDWKLYANYFGTLTVEYANGSHRPAAQQWYDDAYSIAGAGGNCYGMSVSSLRVRNHEFDHMFHAGFFTNAGTSQPWCWWYDWSDTTRETVQQQQGGWYTQEVLDTHGNLWNTQDARALFTRCESLVSQVINRPVLVVWGDGWGHAVVPYDTEVDGNTRRMLVYDNNNPYRENETGAVDPNSATVNWSGNSFAFGSAPKGVLMSYDECTPANPHLPGAEYGGPGAQAAVVVVSPGTEVRQITDEQGKRFFNPDGSVNEDPNTRIPFAVRLFPLVQRPPVLRLPQQTPELGNLAQMLQLRPNGPTLFVFSQPTGKTLSFDLAGDGAKRASFFSAGRILSVEATGAGQLQISGIGQLPAVQIPDPSALMPTSLRYIRSREGGDRMFDLTDLRGLGSQLLRMVPSGDGRELDIQAAPGALFDLNIQGPSGQGMHQASYADVPLEAGGGLLLSPINWGQLSTSELRLQLRNVQTNQPMRQMDIRPLE